MTPEHKQAVLSDLFNNAVPILHLFPGKKKTRLLTNRLIGKSSKVFGIIAKVKIQQRGKHCRS